MSERSEAHQKTKAPSRASIDDVLEALEAGFTSLGELSELLGEPTPYLEVLCIRHGIDTHNPFTWPSLTAAEPQSILSTHHPKKKSKQELEEILVERFAELAEEGLEGEAQYARALDVSQTTLAQLVTKYDLVIPGAASQAPAGIAPDTSDQKILERIDELKADGLVGIGAYATALNISYTKLKRLRTQYDITIPSAEHEVLSLEKQAQLLQQLEELVAGGLTGYINYLRQLHVTSKQLRTLLDTSGLKLPSAPKPSKKPRERVDDETLLERIAHLQSQGLVGYTNYRQALGISANEFKHLREAYALSIPRAPRPGTLNEEELVKRIHEFTANGVVGKRRIANKLGISTASLTRLETKYGLDVPAQGLAYDSVAAKLQQDTDARHDTLDHLTERVQELIAEGFVGVHNYCRELGITTDYLRAFELETGVRVPRSEEPSLAPEREYSDEDFMHEFAILRAQGLRGFSNYMLALGISHHRLLRLTLDNGVRIPSDALMRRRKNVTPSEREAGRHVCEEADVFPTIDARQRSLERNDQSAADYFVNLGMRTDGTSRIRYRRQH
jgi:hypothetical protein